MRLRLGRDRGCAPLPGLSRFSFRGGAVKMSNVHARTMAAPAACVGALLDTLSSADDKFYPTANCSSVPVALDRPC